jgi:hypothetical protein
MEAVRFDLRWKVALALPLDHEGFDPTSLAPSPAPPGRSRGSASGGSAPASA